METVGSAAQRARRAEARAGRGALVGAVLLALALLYLAFSLYVTFALAPGRAPTRLISPRDTFGAIPILLFTAVGALILWRRPENRIGWLLAAGGTLGWLALSLPKTYGVLGVYLWPGRLPGVVWVLLIYQWTWILPLALFLIVVPLHFPDGRLPSPRWRPVLWVTALTTVQALLVLQTPDALSDWHMRNPLPALIPGLSSKSQSTTTLLDTIGFVQFVLFVVCVGAAVASLIVRYRRAAQVERHQLRWLFAGAAAAGVAFLGGGLLGDAGSPVPIIEPVGVTCIPLAIGIAIMRHRLYDIDLIVSRALVYGALAAFITAVYVGVVVGLGTVIGSGSRYNLGLSIVATAVVAVAFQPLRGRLQRLANRLVYGVRATPYEVLSRFSSQVAETYADGDVLTRMARILGEGTGAARAEVWLRTGELLRRAAVWPGAAAEPPAVAVNGQLPPDLSGDRAVPVRHEGELLGALTITKARGDAVTPLEERLLDDLAHQAGLVLKNVGLTADLRARLEELRASRQRLVRAQDEERRRLERNLHDGAQQNLVALKVKLSLAEIMVERDPARAGTLLQELKSETDEALETLRDLARGIYPPLLAEQGLRAAIEAQARKATLPVTVDAGGIGRHSQDVEAAVYFCVLEALQNVQKYAMAISATVRMAEADGRLQFEVIDDGQGFDPGRAHGSGLQNMRDRLEALGGALNITSLNQAGTQVSGSVPVMPAHA